MCGVRRTATHVPASEVSMSGRVAAGFGRRTPAELPGRAEERVLPEALSNTSIPAMHRGQQQTARDARRPGGKQGGVRNGTERVLEAARPLEPQVHRQRALPPFLLALTRVGTGRGTDSDTATMRWAMGNTGRNSGCKRGAQPSNSAHAATARTHTQAVPQHSEIDHSCDVCVMCFPLHPTTGQQRTFSTRGSHLPRRRSAGTVLAGRRPSHTHATRGRGRRQV